MSVRYYNMKKNNTAVKFVLHRLAHKRIVDGRVLQF